MGKSIALLYGLICYVLFLGTFLYAIGFVGDFIVPKNIDGGIPGPVVTAIVVNVLLLGLFAVQHSIMARPAFKSWWTKFISPSVERATFVLATNLALILLYWQWRPMLGTVWSVDDPTWRMVLWAVFAIGWAIVLLSTFMIGHFELFGVTQVLGKQRRIEGDEEFKEPGFYKLVRHPIMVGFIIAFWATPDMTQGHLLFAVVTTAYILIAIQLEERDLIVMLGQAYINYRARVPALVPFTKFGGATKTSTDSEPKDDPAPPA